METLSMDNFPQKYYTEIKESGLVSGSFICLRMTCVDEINKYSNSYFL